MFKKISATICFVLATFFSHAQESDLGNWLIYFGNKKLNDQWNWHNEVQYRNYNFVGDLEQLLLRTGVGYNLTPGNNNLLLGYGFIRSENYVGMSDDKAGFNEHRIYQQYIVKHKLSRVTFQHRFRLEERFVEEDFSMRARYFLSLNIGLNNKEIIDDTFYFSVYNELFMHLESESFDRNRLYAGLGYKLNSKLKFELGYMNQFFSEGGRDQINMIAFVNF